MHLSYIRASRRLYVLAAALLLAAPPLFGTPLLLTKVSLAAFVLMLSGLLFALGGGVGKFISRKFSAFLETSFFGTFTSPVPPSYIL